MSRAENITMENAYCGWPVILQNEADGAMTFAE
jgi:hypothetical protein